MNGLKYTGFGMTENSLVLTVKQPYNEDYEFFTLDLNSEVMGRRQAFSNVVASDTHERKFSVVPDFW
jgi:hypothetical protein